MQIEEQARHSDNECGTKSNHCLGPGAHISRFFRKGFVL